MRGMLAERYESLLYYRAAKDSGGISRGDVWGGGRIIYAYPHIPRVLSPSGVVKHVSPAYAEEKKDGYNVRVACIDGEIYAFLRSGLVDPFATTYLRGQPPILQFFKHFPEKVLNVELLGDTPYTSPYGRVEYYAFDIMDGDSFLPVLERRRILAKLRVSQTPLLGEVEKEHEVIAIMKGLERLCKEGAVFKSPDRKKAVKLVTPCSDMEQLNKASFLFDLSTRFVEQRIFRSALMELFLNTSHHDIKVLKDRIKEFVKEGVVFSTHKVRVPTLFVWKEIVKVLSRSKEIYIKDVEITMVEGGYEITFKKVYKKSSQFLQAFLEGKAFVD